jgi:hypothetical protein
MPKYPFNDYDFIYIAKPTRPLKKYKAALRNKKTGKNTYVHFGDKRYEQYKDTTDLKLYSKQDHNDKKRRDAYLKRHNKTIAAGSPPVAYSAAYFAKRFLWSDPKPEKKKKTGKGVKKGMGETEIERVFHSLVPKYHKLLGKGGTNNHQLDVLGEKIFGKEWRTVSDQKAYDLSKPRKRSFSIINNDFRGSGQHWLAVYHTPTTIYVWDSFGRAPEAIVPVLKKRAAKAGTKYVANDRDAEQADAQEDCGARCLAWLECVKTFGIRSAMKV